MEFLFLNFKLRIPRMISIFSTIILLSFTLFIPNNFVFAQETIMVNIPADVTRGCEDTNECFIPYVVKAEVGGTVIWSNSDTKPHSVTSGSPVLGLDGIFNSGFLKSGETFSHTFDEEGKYPYFSITAPWMQGIVFVGQEIPSSYLEPKTKPIQSQNKWIEKTTKDDEVYHQRLLSQSPVFVRIFTDQPQANEGLQISLEFVDPVNFELINHINYDLTATQNEKTVLAEKNVYDAEGRGDHTTLALDSDDPVDIQITMLGFGMPGEGSELASPTGEVITFTVIPEYGQIALLVLVFGIVIVITLNSKYQFSKLSHYN